MLFWDHLFINAQVGIFTHAIDPAGVEGEFPSDYFPVFVDLFFKTLPEGS